MPELEKPLTRSPLLRDAVIERDYTRGIENQLTNKSQPAPPPPTPEDTTKKPPPPPEPSQTQSFNHDFQEPDAFSFNQEVTDASDVTGEEPEGIGIASESAKAFANVIGDLVKTKLPEIGFNFVRIDMGNVEVHISNGNINPSLRPVFEQINVNTFMALQFSDDEIKMWKKALKEYLEYKGVKAANPETAFWIATGVLGLTFGLKINQLNKMNKQYLIDAIESYNPSYFDSFISRMEEDNKKASKKQTTVETPIDKNPKPSKEPEKTKV